MEVHSWPFGNVGFQGYLFPFPNWVNRYISYLIEIKIHGIGQLENNQIGIKSIIMEQINTIFVHIVQRIESWCSYMETLML